MTFRWQHLANATQSSVDRVKTALFQSSNDINEIGSKLKHSANDNNTNSYKRLVSQEVYCSIYNNRIFLWDISVC
jgi:uncharacterized protein YaaR (DUF327 family)